MLTEKQKENLKKATKAARIINTGKKRTVETKNKISKSHMGMRYSDEHKKKLSEIHKKLGTIPPSRKGIKHSDKTKKKMSKATKGKKKPIFSEEHKRKIGFALMGNKHSEESKKKQNLRLRGEKSHFWKGGITKINLIIRKSFKYKEWRFKVFQRDNFTCKICGDNRGRNLNAHHIKSFRELLDEAKIDISFLPMYDIAMTYEPIWNINNGITLCNKCHKENQYMKMKL